MAMLAQTERQHLLYGEWLRRESRRLEARRPLHRADDLFSRAGADGFAERARRELLATGESVRKRMAETSEELTAQEAQIAGWLATISRIPRSAPSCSSVLTPSSGTSATCSPSSTSPPEDNCAAHCQIRALPPRRRNQDGVRHLRQWICLVRRRCLMPSSGYAGYRPRGLPGAMRTAPG